MKRCWCLLTTWEPVSSRRARAIAPSAPWISTRGSLVRGSRPPARPSAIYTPSYAATPAGFRVLGQRGDERQDLLHHVCALARTCLDECPGDQQAHSVPDGVPG